MSRAATADQPLAPRPTPVRVVADEPLWAEALVALLSRERWLAAGEASSIPVAFDDLRRQGRGAVIGVVDRAGVDVFHALFEIRNALPSVGLCLITDRVDRVGLADMLRTSPGAFALLHRSSRPTRRDLLVALHALASGRVLLPPAELEVLISDHRHDTDVWSRLTAIEREIVALLSRGLRNRSIAGRIGRSEKTVERLVTSLYERFDLDRESERRVLLARLFLLRSSALVEAGLLARIVQ